jgi:hypothetical protein
LLPNQKNPITLLFRKWLFTPFLFIALFPFVANAQWTVNPEKAKKLVVDTYQPINLLTGDMAEGGMFVVWQDKKESPDPAIYIQSIEVNGRVRFRADGRKVTELSGKKDAPVLKVSDNSIAHVLWKDYSYNPVGDLYLQKIQAGGVFEWGDNGRIVTLSKFSPTFYTLALDPAGNSYVAYIEKIDTENVEYGVRLQKLTPAGERIFLNNGVRIASSRTVKTNVQVCPDDLGGAYIYWLESLNGKSVLHMQHLNAEGEPLGGKKPVQISPSAMNIISYSAVRFSSGEILVSWQIGPKIKEIYFQIVEANGYMEFSEPRLVAPKIRWQKSNLTAVACPDSTVMVGWIAEKTPVKKEVMLQKISRHGLLLWDDDAEFASLRPSSKYSGSISVDKYSNVYAAWIERRDQLSSEFIFGQKLNSKGIRQWDSTGVPILTSKGTEKSYLTSFADKRQGMVVVLREGRKVGADKTARTEYEIYGQRLYAEHNAVNIINDLNATVDQDSVIVSWKSAENAKMQAYRIEKFLLKSVKDTTWSPVTVLPAKPFSMANEYRYSFVPDSDGIYYIRVVQLADNNPAGASEIMKISYIRDYGDKIVVLQNNPNPFPDSTVINFYLPRRMPVRFEFYNSRIEKMDEVNLNDTRRGRNSYTFYAGKLPSGIYFFRFTAGDLLEVKKFVIAR